MSVVLFINAREKEYDEKIHTHQIDIVKKRGRIGIAIYFIIAFAFLSRELMAFLYQIFKNLPEPAIIINYMPGSENISLNNLQTLDMGFRTLFLFSCLLSLMSLVMIIIGIYLMLFNKFIIRSKLKFMAFIGGGVIFWILVGFKISLRLMI
ncbi:MAG: hypothetical protein ACFE8N_15135 [Promethearchaeota archaeon]